MKFQSTAGAARRGGGRDTVSAASSIDQGSGGDADGQRAGLIGAGVMGSGIAQMLAQAGCDVVCVDNDPAQLERAAELVETGRYGLARAVERGKLTAAD